MFKPVNLTLQGPYHVSAILHSSTPADAGCSSCQGTAGQRPFTASGQRSVPCPMWRSACPCLRPPAPTCSLAKHSRPMSATNIYTLLSVRIPGRACILYPHLPHRFHRHGQTSRPMLASDDSGAISLLCLYLRPTISHTFVCSMARPSKRKLRPSRTC